AGFEVNQPSAIGIEPRDESDEDRRALPSENAKAVAGRWRVQGYGCFQELRPCPRRCEAGLLQQRLLVMQNAGRDAVGDACQLAVVTCRLFRAGQEVVPVEIGMLLVDLFEQ